MKKEIGFSDFSDLTENFELNGKNKIHKLNLLNSYEKI